MLIIKHLIDVFLIGHNNNVENILNISLDLFEMKKEEINNIKNLLLPKDLTDSAERKNLFVRQRFHQRPEIQHLLSGHFLQRD